MSRPDTSGELRDVTVEAISLVSKAANGEKFKIFKNAKEKQEAKVPETVLKDERGLFRILKEFFTGKEVEKGEVADIYQANTSGTRLFEAFNALIEVLGLSRYSEDVQNPETDSEKIISALDDFKNVALEILLDKSEVEKFGRKISGARLGKLKNIQTMLNDVLSEFDEVEDIPKEAEEMTKEEIQKAVDDAVKAVDIDKAVQKAMTPLIERIEKIENARGVSNKVHEDSAVEKSTNDFWGGILMSSNRQMMKDAITTEIITGNGKGGLLSPEQAKKFISYMTDSTALLNDTRLEQMASSEKQLDFLLIGSRLIRKATEASSPSELAAANTSRKELRSTKVRLAADITSEFMEDNIEGQSISERIAQELAQQFGNDLADLMLNVDTTATGADASFLTIGDGIIKQAKASSDTHKFKLTGTDYKGTIVPGMLSLMPNKFKNDRRNMRIYCSSSVADTYILSVTNREIALGGDVLASGRFDRFLGIQVFPVEYMPDDVIILTHRLNLVSGVQREMKVYSHFNQRKDLTEYTMYMRLDPGKIVWDDALVIAYPY